MKLLLLALNLALNFVPVPLAPAQEPPIHFIHGLWFDGTRFIPADFYGADALQEAGYLAGLHLWSNLELLRMWSVTTPQAIFPKRRLGLLEPGYEASFLVLAANPLQDFAATHQILERWKQGHALPEPASPAKP